MRGHKKVRRIYREEKLQVRRRGGRKRALGTRKPLVLPRSRCLHASNCRAVDGPNQRWSLDFVSDALTDGRRFRILAVVDDFSRENLVLGPIGRFVRRIPLRRNRVGIFMFPRFA